MKMMKRLVLVSSGVVLASILVLGLLIVPDRYFSPQPYVTHLKKGMSYAEVSSIIPRRIVAADLHPIRGVKDEYGRLSMQRKGIQATHMVVLEDILWPLTQATVCYLYFDDGEQLVDWFISSS